MNVAHDYNHNQEQIRSLDVEKTVPNASFLVSKCSCISAEFQILAYSWNEIKIAQPSKEL